MKRNRKAPLLRPMRDKTFNIVMAVVIAVCFIGTAALFAYTAYCYHYVSIIRFIAGERWWGL